MQLLLLAAAKMMPEKPRFQSLGLTLMHRDQQTKNERKAYIVFARWRGDEADELQKRNNI